MKHWIPILMIAMVASLSAGEWHVDTNADNRVRFTSETFSLEFHGETDQIDGYIYWEGEEMFLGKSQLQMDVDLNSLETGIGKRDRDMRETLETDKYPVTTYKGAITAVEPIDSTLSAWRVQSEGTILIHGVEQPLSVPATVTVDDRGRMHVTARFEVKLTDFQIEVPSLMFLKVNENIRLYVDFYLREAS